MTGIQKTSRCFSITHVLSSEIMFKPVIAAYYAYTSVRVSETSLPLRRLLQIKKNGKRGVHPTPEKNETVGFGCLGHSNWTICSPFSPFCSGNFPTFSLSYWGANSYYPRGLIMGVGRISHLPIWMTQRGFSAWGIQTGPFAAP